MEKLLTIQAIPKKILFLGTFLSIAFFFLWDLGNLDGLRQGTEGFYLIISRDMFLDENFLTPKYLGGNHWSKPPLHFWLPFPFYSLLGDASIFAARLSIVILSLGCIFYISKWTEKHFSIPTIFTALFLASTIGVLKYSRIFMMEIPLTFITASSALLFFDAIETKRLSHLLTSAVLLGLSCLIKGPISIVMCTASAFIYTLFLLYFFKEKIISKLFLWIVVGILISSIWFLLSYFKYGLEFFNYFFIRENLGKFSAKSYPVSSLIQGLLIYSFPWCFFIPHAALMLKKTLRGEIDSPSVRALIFLLINFVIFFFIWFIPNQKSHHYAMPSLPFLLIIIITSIFHVKNKKADRFAHYFISSFFILMAIIFLYVLSFEQTTSNFFVFFKLGLTLMLSILTAILFIKRADNFFKFIAALYTLGMIWTVLIPTFALPFVPQKVVSLIGNSQVGVVVHKPYFVEEALNKEVDVLDAREIVPYIIKNQHFYLVHKSLYDAQELQNFAAVVARWNIWKRGSDFSEILTALKQQDLTMLQEEMVLLRNKSK